MSHQVEDVFTASDHVWVLVFRILSNSDVNVNWMNDHWISWDVQGIKFLQLFILTAFTKGTDAVVMRFVSLKKGYP